MQDETKPHTPIDPLSAALAPFSRNAKTIWHFYWEMAWRPRHFSEKYIRTPDKTSITRAVKHTFWLTACLAALLGFNSAVGGILDIKPQAHNPFVFMAIYLPFFINFGLVLSTIPMATILWLLTKNGGLSLFLSHFSFL